ncbi:hypothetical protein, partial [Ralstonia pseudosolanacearum]|uniref:hypothetical protein n=1 Tax=Ralstonia pseudosolanacearum TaxID=1310165 RepID=UPI003CEE7BE0
FPCGRGRTGGFPAPRCRRPRSARSGRADTLLARYFDTQSPRVVAEQTLLQQARASVGALEVPTLADSLAAARGQGKE